MRFDMISFPLINQTFLQACPLVRQKHFFEMKCGWVLWSRTDGHEYSTPLVALRRAQLVDMILCVTLNLQFDLTV